MTELNQKQLPAKTKINKFFLCFCLALLSLYPIYRNFYYSNGLLTYERDQSVLQGKSEFYNPWQYRILCPYTIEGIIWIYNRTIDKVYPIDKKVHFTIDNTSGISDETAKFIQLMQTPGVIKYMLIFILFRFVEHLFIFYLSWKLWEYFVKSQWLIFFGINFLAIGLGNAVAAADLSFNTYLDIIFYLLTANIIVYKKNPLWLFVIIPLASFNRETCLMIPALYFISVTDFTQFSFRKFNIKDIGFPKTIVWLQTIALYIIYFAIFIGLRYHYGYQPAQRWKVPSGWPMLKLNLFGAVGVKGYFELLGTFGVILLIVIYQFRVFPHLLKKWFLFIVPVWFFVHYISVVAYETRTFIMPMVLTFLPMFLWLIEKEIRNLKADII